MNTKFIIKKERQKALILEVGVDSTHEEEVLETVTEWIAQFRKEKGRKRLIFTPNPEMLVEAYEDERFKEVLNSADINIPDGVGLQWASRRLAFKKMIKPDQIISDRVTGTDLTLSLVKLASVRGYRVYFLGGQKGVAEVARQSILRQVQDDKVAEFKIEVDEGPQPGLEPEHWRIESERTIERVNKFKPDLLFVAFGHKKQETWLTENRDRLEFGVALGVGGAFDFLSGKVKRAPVILRSLGLEWLFRLVLEPWRWRRQLRLVRFVWLVLRP